MENCNKHVSIWGVVTSNPSHLSFSPATDRICIYFESLKIYIYVNLTPLQLRYNTENKMTTCFLLRIIHTQSDVTLKINVFRSLNTPILEKSRLQPHTLGKTVVGNRHGGCYHTSVFSSPLGGITTRKKFLALSLSAQTSERELVYIVFSDLNAVTNKRLPVGSIFPHPYVTFFLHISTEIVT